MGLAPSTEPEKFASSVAEYVAREWDSARDRAVLAHLLGCTEEELAESSVRYEKLMEWLFDDRDHRDHPVSDFLFKLDEFNLNDYIKAIHFDELKVPSVPFQMPTSKTYFGLDQMMESELDFLKATVISKSTEAGDHVQRHAPWERWRRIRNSRRSGCSAWP